MIRLKEEANGVLTMVLQIPSIHYVLIISNIFKNRTLLRQSASLKQLHRPCCLTKKEIIIAKQNLYKNWENVGRNLWRDYLSFPPSLLITENNLISNVNRI